jgi:hypothetical protein
MVVDFFVALLTTFNKESIRSHQPEQQDLKTRVHRQRLWPLLETSLRSIAAQGLSQSNAP